MRQSKLLWIRLEQEARKQRRKEGRTRQSDSAITIVVVVCLYKQLHSSHSKKTIGSSTLYRFSFSGYAFRIVSMTSVSSTDDGEELSTGGTWVSRLYVYNKVYKFRLLKLIYLQACIYSIYGYYCEDLRVFLRTYCEYYYEHLLRPGGRSISQS